MKFLPYIFSAAYLTERSVLHICGLCKCVLINISETWNAKGIQVYAGWGDEKIKRDLLTVFYNHGKFRKQWFITIFIQLFLSVKFCHISVMKEYCGIINLIFLLFLMLYGHCVCFASLPSHIVWRFKLIESWRWHKERKGKIVDSSAVHNWKKKKKMNLKGFKGWERPSFES